MKRTYSQIDIDERRKIARWRTIGISVDVIASAPIDVGIRIPLALARKHGDDGLTFSKYPLC